ncbi:DUF362 domain-containing protein [candidate division KSB1 bacterium]|nr:DUF362 domain-containing protein [candidate division KSB1 bacterium]MBL7094443.1 DUF362 domain-containing protein [candidate division KSB1 bacterium]
MKTRREFIKDSAITAGGITLLSSPLMCTKISESVEKSQVVSAATDDMLDNQKYNPDAVHRAFNQGLKELTGENSLKNSWASMFSPDDVVGIKINCLGAPKISSSVQSINETIAGLKSAGVKENNIIVWDRMDREFKRTGLKINKSPEGVRVHGTSTKWEGAVPWIEGYDRNVYVSFEDGTLKKFRELVKQNFTETGTHREIFNSVAWLWMLIQQGNEKAQKYKDEIRKLYMDYSDREGIKKVAEEVANEFNDVTIEDEEKSFFSEIVTQKITKLINIAVLKHNEDSGVTWAAKNIALGVTTNKIRFHIDYCTKAIPEILNKPCIRDKMVLHIGEAAKISTVSVVGAQLAFDNRIFFSKDPVAMDRVGLDILEKKRIEQGLDPIKDISTHIAACAAKDLGTCDLSKIDLRELIV